MKKQSKIIFAFSIVLFLSFYSCGDQYPQGAIIYKNNCSNCHGANGEGLRSLYPPLKNADYLIENQDNLPCIIRYGIHEPIIVNGKKFTTPMEGIEEISDIDITNLVNFIQNKWGDNKSYNSLKDVKIKLEACK